MNTRNLLSHALRLMLVCALSLGGTAASAEQVTLEVSMGHPVVLAGGPQKAYLRVSLTGIELPDKSKRTPVNVAIVLDKSGSMTGEKIANARRAAIKAIGMLEPNDIVSVVTYDDTVHVLVPATKVADRDQIFAAIERIQAGGSTALFAGVSKGAAEVRKFLDKNRVNRVILLSDGLANIGPSSPGDLAELGTSLGRESISVTTIGLGLDYNEDLMTQLAQKSDGNHMFAQNAGDLEWIFAREFGDVLSVVAQDVEIIIECARGIKPIRCIGREADIAGQRVTTSMNQLYGGQQKYILLEVELPDARAGEAMKVATISAGYNDMNTKRRDRLSGSASVFFADSQEKVEADANTEILSTVVYQVGVEENKRAVQLRDEGKIVEAQNVLDTNAQFLLENAEKYDNDELRTYYQKNIDAKENLGDADWRRQRKIMLEEQHAIINQQKLDNSP